MTDINHFKALLETEKKELESQLSQVGRPNPRDPNEWEPKPLPTEDTNIEFRDDLADLLEEEDEREAEEAELERRLHEVKHALERVTKGTYGVCEIGGEEIEAERLEANPAAHTCKKHLDAR